MMQNILQWCNKSVKMDHSLLGRLRTVGKSDLSKSKLNSYAIYNTTNTFLCTPKTRTHEGPFNIYQIIGQVHWHTGHILFFLYTPAWQVDSLRFFFLNSSWTGRIQFFTQTIRFFFLFNSWLGLKFILSIQLLGK